MSIISVELFRKLQTVDPSLREVLIAILEEIEKQQKERVTKNEFRELKDVVAQLVEAQKQTEIRIKELTKAQKRTEERVNRLEKVVEELAEAQKRTEERVEELAEAQKRTEEEIAKLTRRMDIFEERLEGISNSVGYSLEDKSYKSLPEILKQRFGIEVTGRLIRKYISLGKKDIQINIYGNGKKNGKDILIIGECKVRPSKREIDRFYKYAIKIADKEGKEPFLLFVANDFPPRIEEFLNQRDIPYIWSYEL